MDRLQRTAIKCLTVESFIVEVLRQWNWYKTEDLLNWTKKDLEKFYEEVH